MDKSSMKKNSWTYLAYQILKENGKPMHYKEITKKALISKKTKGKTPSYSLQAAMWRNLEFIRLGEGYYGLREWGKRK